MTDERDITLEYPPRAWSDPAYLREFFQEGVFYFLFGIAAFLIRHERYAAALGCLIATFLLVAIFGRGIFYAAARSRAYFALVLLATLGAVQAGWYWSGAWRYLGFLAWATAFALLPITAVSIKQEWIRLRRGAKQSNQPLHPDALTRAGERRR